MKLLYCYEKGSTVHDIAWGFVEIGVDIVLMEYGLNPKAEEELLQSDVEYIRNKILAEKFEGVFGWNYYAAASIACELCGIPYISWIWDSPLLYVYGNTMRNSCNYIFAFDRTNHMDIKQKGGNSFYLPLACNITRLSGVCIDDEDVKKYSADISFVGSVYQNNSINEVNHRIPRDLLEKYNQIFDMQLGNWKDNILYQQIGETDLNVMNDLFCIPGIDNYPNASMKDIYIGFVLSRKMAEIERKTILNLLAKDNEIILYNSKDVVTDLKGVICKPGVSYEVETPKVYYLSKINLNITLRSIQTGVPLRVFDITGVGGFLMSNYQQEIEELFIPGYEIETYKSLEELEDKVLFYLNNEKARLSILARGYKRTASEHTVSKRAEYIMNTVYGTSWKKH